MNKAVLGILIVAVVILSVATFNVHPQTKLGSVSDGYAYTSTTTGASVTTNPTLKTSAGVFGSVVITGTNSGVIIVYDASTSDVTKRALATSSLTVLAAFQGTVAAGSYVFDSAFSNGLTLGMSGSVPTTTITWR